MIFEFTAEEMQQFATSDLKAAAKLDEIDKEIKEIYSLHLERANDRKTAAEDLQLKYEQLLQNRELIEYERMDEFAEIREAAEDRFFKSFNNNVPAIVAEVKKQLPLIFKRLLENDLVFDTKNNELLEKWENGEVSDEEATEEFKKINLITRTEAEHAPTIEVRRARRLIYWEIRYFDEFLKQQAPAEKKELDKFIQNFINSDSHTYQKKKGKIKDITIKGKGANNIDFPVDKANSHIWRMLETSNKSGQLEYAFAVEGKDSKTPADVIYSINFDELEAAGIKTVKRLTPYDKRVYIAVSALFNSGMDIMTVSQIYYTMGNDSRINKRDIDRLYTSLEKMRHLPITLDNSSEHKLYKNIPEFKYNGVLLPWESIDAIINGQRAEGVIHPFREPPLISFAKGRNQFTTISRRLLASPISKTDAHLQIDDYLLERISHIKNGRASTSSKILFKTIFEKTNLKERHQKNRAKPVIKEYLEHYKRENFIKEFTIEEDGITIEI